MNNKRVLQAQNIIVVQVTATPYCLQSIASMVSMDMPLKNEVYWSSIPEQYCGLEVRHAHLDLGGFMECRREASNIAPDTFATDLPPTTYKLDTFCHDILCGFNEPGDVGIVENFRAGPIG